MNALGVYKNMTPQCCGPFIYVSMPLELTEPFAKKLLACPFESVQLQERLQAFCVTTQVSGKASVHSVDLGSMVSVNVPLTS
jgi:hypothetical protein